MPGAAYSITRLLKAIQGLIEVLQRSPRVALWRRLLAAHSGEQEKANGSTIVQKEFFAWLLLQRNLRICRRFPGLSTVIVAAVDGTLTMIVLASCTMRSLIAHSKTLSWSSRSFGHCDHQAASLHVVTNGRSDFQGVCCCGIERKVTLGLSVGGYLRRCAVSSRSPSIHRPFGVQLNST